MTSLFHISCSKTTVVALFTLLSFTAVAVEKTKVKSTIEEVTVFLNGAQVKRTGETVLDVGRNKIHFVGLPLSMDNKSLQFSTNAPVTILSINHQVVYLDESQKDSTRIFGLEKRLKKLGRDVKIIESTTKIYNQEKQVLINNSKFGGTKNGTSVTELEQGLNLIRKRLLAINSKLIQLGKETETINTERQSIRNQLENYRNKSAVKSGEVVVILNCDKSMRADLSLNYTVQQASWKPYYDLKVKNVNSPLLLVYKAKVAQSTGESWDKVKINLSTGDPSQTGQLPPLVPWFLNFTTRRYISNATSGTRVKMGVSGYISGIILDARSSEALIGATIVAKTQNGEIVQGSSTAFDGKFSLELTRPAHSIQISYIGYATQTIYLNNQNRYYRINMSESSQVLEEVVVTGGLTRQFAGVVGGGVVSTKNAGADGGVYFVDGIKIRGGKNGSFLLTRNPTTFNFSVDEPYDIPSDGQDYVVTLQEYSLDADYLYKAVPKLEENAYLTAGITQWDQLSLRNGTAGIYYEGVYMGETYLDVESAGDTLQISLGKDEDIVIKREEILSKEKVRLVSSSKQESFHYRISVRNNKQGKIKLLIQDQYPISANDKIKVKQEESSNGKLNEETGMLEWLQEIEANKDEEINIKYRITYPKDKIINLY